LELNFLQRLHTSKLLHRTLSSSERLMRILRPIVEARADPVPDLPGAREQRRPVDGSPSPLRAIIVTAKPSHAGDGAIAQRIRGNSAPTTLKPDASIAFKSDS
jgi:hypothetical protein